MLAMFNFKCFVRFTLLSLATCFLAGLSCQATTTHKYIYQIILDIAPETLRGANEENVDRTLPEALKNESKTQLSKTLLKKIYDVIASPSRNLHQEGNFIRNFKGNKKWRFWEKMKGKTLITFRVQSAKGIKNLIKKNEDSVNPYLTRLGALWCLFRHFKLNGYEWGEIQLKINTQWVQGQESAFQKLPLIPLEFQETQPKELKNEEFGGVFYDLAEEKIAGAIPPKILEDSFTYKYTEDLKRASFYYKNKPYEVGGKEIDKWKKIGQIREYFKNQNIIGEEKVFFPDYGPRVEEINIENKYQDVYVRVRSYEKDYLDKEIDLPELHPLLNIPCVIEVEPELINDSEESELKELKASYFAPSTENKGIKKDIEVALQDCAEKLPSNRGGTTVNEMLSKPCTELFPIMEKDYFQALMPMRRFKYFFQNLSEEKKRALLFNFHSDKGLEAKTELQQAKKLMRASVYIMGTLGLKLWQNHLAELDLNEFKNRSSFSENFFSLKEVANLVFSYDFLLSPEVKNILKKVVESCEIENNSESIRSKNIQTIKALKAASVAHTAYIKLLNGKELVIKYKKPDLNEEGLDEEEKELGMDSKKKNKDYELRKQVRSECDFKKEVENWESCKTQYEAGNIVAGISCVQVPENLVMLEDDKQFSLLSYYIKGDTLPQIYEKMRQGSFATNAVIKLGNRIKQLVCHWLYNLLFVKDTIIIHGDLHGGNVLVSMKTGKAVVIDFGVVIEIGISDFTYSNLRKKDFFKQFFILINEVYEDLKESKEEELSGELHYGNNEKIRALINYIRKTLIRKNVLKDDYSIEESKKYKSLEHFRKDFCKTLKESKWDDQKRVARKMNLFDKPMSLIEEFNETVESWLKIKKLEKVDGFKIKPLTLNEIRNNNCSTNVEEEEKEQTSESDNSEDIKDIDDNKSERKSDTGDDITDQNLTDDDKSEQGSDTEDDETNQNLNNNKPPNKQGSNIRDDGTGQDSNGKGIGTTTIVMVSFGLACVIAGSILVYVKGGQNKHEKRKKRNRNQYKKAQLIRASA